MLADFTPSLIVTRRELRDHLRDWRIVSPLVLLVAVSPILMNYLARRVTGFAASYGLQIQADQLHPFLFMIVGFFPVAVALVLALESFVGEKERRSLEPLLSSPLSALQLYAGKLLASLIPPLAASYLAMGFYLLELYRQGGWQPDAELFIQVFALATVNCLVMVSAAVVISTQTTSLRGANLMSFVIILPMAVLLQGQSAAIVWGRDEVMWWTVLGLVLIVVLLIRTGVAHFNREELFGREMDTLNLRWAWKTFWNAFKGKAGSPSEWYRQELNETLRRLKLPLALMAVVLAVAAGVGVLLAHRYVIPPELIDPGFLERGSLEGMPSFRFFEAEGVPLVWAHNLQTVLLASLLGIFSYGVLAIMVLMLPLALIGYITTASAGAGLSPFWILLALVAPHGVLEIPAIALSGAAILRLGAVLAAPSPGRTIGEAWLHGLADWARVMVGLVVPLLLGAAALEVLLTPQIALLVFGD
jgi:uncharacterized membrane protein SpoIIM required for sporulation